MMEEGDSDIPSRSCHVLRRTLGRVIVGLEKYHRRSLEEKMETSHAPPEQMFALLYGPLYITLDNGLIVGAGSDPSLASVVIGIEQHELGAVSPVSVKYPVRSSPAFHRVDVLDPVYSNDTMRSFLNKRIETFRLYERCPANASLAARPREAALVLVCEGNRELILSHGLHDDSDDFSVLTWDMVLPELVPQLHEIPLAL